MPRGARLDAPGTLHHVIVRGIERKRIVTDDADRKNFVNRMGDMAAETDTAIYAWALLENHAHILLRSGSFGLPTYMRRLLTGGDHLHYGVMVNGLFVNPIEWWDSHWIEDNVTKKLDMLKR